MENFWNSELHSEQQVAFSSKKQGSSLSGDCGKHLAQSNCYSGSSHKQIGKCIRAEGETDLGLGLHQSYGHLLADDQDEAEKYPSQSSPEKENSFLRIPRFLKLEML